MRKILLQTVLMFVVLTVLTGLIYPLLVTAVAHACCARAAEGSLLERHGHVVGSELIGQSFSDPKYFWGRPSATTPGPYDPTSSSGSNLGPTNSAQADAVKMHADALRAVDPGNTLPIPVDLVTASGSGLDPHISPAAAEYQLARVARARHRDPVVVRAIVERYTQGRQWGIFGEPRVNVLEVNLALDDMN
jgi:K+-transporting ATPase ATPase C chain